MKIAINIYPLKSNHKNRGIGYYTINLLNELKNDKSLIIQEFENKSDLKNVDVVHYPWFDFFFKTLPLKKKFPTIVTIHDVIPLLFPKYYPVGLKGKINFQLQKFALGNCNFIITDSQASKKDIINHLKIKADKIRVIPLAVNSNFTTLRDTELIRTKRKYGLPDQFLLYVGDANWVKNLPFLIEGFESLRRRSNFDKLKLVLVGGVFLKKVENIDHPELESLKQVNRLISNYQLENLIIRPGIIHEKELVAFYNLASLYVQPSLYEGFGLPILQALSCGTPVVSSRAGSLPEVGGDAVIYFDPTNLNQFVSIIEGVLQDKALQHKLSKLGLEQAAKFSWEKCVRETKLVYMETKQT